MSTTNELAVKALEEQIASYDARRKASDTIGADESVLFYLGDHDPSGEDMVRDIRERLELFGANVDVRKLALTMAQIREYEPPPNPAKVTDSRFAAYSAKHGDESWEVDALDPTTLAGIITDAFAETIDVEKMDAVKAKEEADKKRLTKLVATAKWSDASTGGGK